jgi:hypothetical protein
LVQAAAERAGARELPNLPLELAELKARIPANLRRVGGPLLVVAGATRVLLSRRNVLVVSALGACGRKE